MPAAAGDVARRYPWSAPDCCYYAPGRALVRPRVDATDASAAGTLQRIHAAERESSTEAVYEKRAERLSGRKAMMASRRSGGSQPAADAPVAAWTSINAR
jgi:hypothetical protein